MTDKEKAKENYTKVYLNGDMSLDTEEKYFAYTKGYCKGHTDGLAEGRKETTEKISALEKENEKQKAQIKKMKCCHNCKNKNSKPTCFFCIKLNKWELEE